MIKKILSIAAIILIVFTVTGQHLDVREEVYLQTNSAFMLTGETLYFSAFVRSADTGQPSPLSSILYVELVGADGKPVFQKKIHLTHGRGNGTFFLSSLVSSGRYQLLAYTRWMKNFQDYFQTPITVINPFEEYPQPAQNEELSVSFYPEGGVMVAGHENDLVMKIDQGNPAGIGGRVVSASGEKIAYIPASQIGLSHFTIPVKEGESYQTILEDQAGNFHFFDLPKVTSDGATIQIRDAGHSYGITPIGPSSPGILTLSIHDGQNAVFQQTAVINARISLPKTKLVAGTYLVTLTSGSGDQLASRLLWHPGSLREQRSEGMAAYHTRSPVTIPLEFDHGADVSVSVRRMEIGHQPTSAIHQALFGRINKSWNLSVQETSDWKTMDNSLMASEWKGPKTEMPKTVKWLPELRGELIEGALNYEAPSEDKPPFVALSISGDDYQLQTAQVDEHGHFQLLINPAEGPREAYISVLGSTNEVSFQLEGPFLQAYPPFDYSLPYLDSSQVSALVERSVRNQIENAYYELKKDSIVPQTYWNPLFDYDISYVLDDYNRFPELYEHFIEFIPEVMARKNKTRSKIKVLTKYVTPGSLDPLLLIDGVPTTAEEILDFSPYKIESIGIINNRVFVGPLVADGIVSFHTFERNLHGYKPGPNSLNIQYKGLDPVQQFSFPSYEDADQRLARIPDYRQQLFWNPSLTVGENGTKELEFYTGDTAGTFEVSIDGYDKNGSPISIRRYFKVQSTNPPASN